MYINDLPGCLKTVSHHMFADDVQLFFSFKKGCYNEAVFRVNQDLYEINRWARDNFLSLNAKKSQVIIFCETGDKLLSPNLLPNVLLNGVVIPYADKVLNLGIAMDQKLSFKDQVSNVCSKVFSRLRSLWPNSHMFPLKTRLMLVKTLILPAFTYAASAYLTSLSAADIGSLERAFSACVRFTYRLRRYDSAREYVDRVLGCPIMTYLKQRRCSAVHAISVTKTPSYLYDKLCLGRASRNPVFIIPRHSSRQYNRSFFVSAISDYNFLPVDIKKLRSLPEFGRACLDCLKA